MNGRCGACLCGQARLRAPAWACLDAALERIERQPALPTAPQGAT